jgi:[acyl-carrier-protein] S-malonyltransferase
MLAFTFPGQGSQRPGMGRPWADHESWELVEEASDNVERDVARLLLDADADELKDTRNAQLCTFVTSLMVVDAVERLGIEPGVCAGHSLGEYTALVAAGAISLAEALPLVRFRAEAMQDAVPVGVGAMAAVLGLDAAAVRAGCDAAREATGEVVSAANYNDPRQTVIAGSKAGVDKACELLKAAGAKRTLPLSVSAPFHSPLMKPAADRLREKLASAAIVAPRIPVINNIDVRIETDPAAIRDALYRQAYGPVRWEETIRAIRARSVTDIFECGPGKVLSNLTRRIDAGSESVAVHDPASLTAARALLG